MDEAASARAPSGPEMGRYVTVRFAAAPEGVACVVEAEDGRSLRLRPLQAAGPLPVPDERVTCTGSLGSWVTTVLSSREGCLELVTPSWRTRPTPRHARRVVAEAGVTLRAGEGAVAGHLQDLSLAGAAVLVEGSAAFRVGDRLQVEVPGGTAQATVRSVRPHAHRRLVVLGLSFERLDPAATRWVAGLVARAVQGETGPSGPVSRPAGGPRSS